jgi:transposase
MKKNIIRKDDQQRVAKTRKSKREKECRGGKPTVGMDLGDRNSRYCVVNEARETLKEGKLATTRSGVNELLAKMPPSRVVLEAGTHSAWVSWQAAQLGHEVIVVNPHKVKLITQSTRKNDRIDARKLAQLAVANAGLLSPIRHRGPEAHADLAVIRARAELVEARTALINSARGLVKPMGERLRKCDADQVGEALAEGMSEAARSAIVGMLKAVEALSAQIREYDQKIEEMAQRYPQVSLLTPVYGVGTLIGLTYLLTIDDAQRFKHSREVGPYLGLQPKQQDSGNRQPELGITKTGDRLLRSYLVQAAHCNLRKKAPDNDIRAWGLKKAGSGGKGAKKRAVVGMARKLAVLLHRLWVTGEVYDPLYNRKMAEAKLSKTAKTAA